MSRDASDADLIASSRDEPEAFTAIFDRHYEAISAFLRWRVDASTADELAAETFLVAFRGRAGYELDRASAKPWLYGIATNLLRRNRRAEGRRLRAYARLDAGAQPDPSEEAVRRADAAALRGILVEGLGALSVDERDALLLLTWADLSYEEIAEALEIPIGTVRSRISRARRRMRELINREDELTTGEGVQVNG